MIDLATAKAHLRVDTDDEDALIQAYINASIGAVQAYTDKLLTSQNVSQVVDGFPCSEPIRLFRNPVTAIVSIKYDDPSGVEQTLTDFRLIEGVVARLLPSYGARWPEARSEAGSVRITYTAGYGAEEIPPELDQAVLLLTGHYHANREAVIADMRAAAVELPLGIEMLLAPYAAPGIA